MRGMFQVVAREVAGLVLPAGCAGCGGERLRGAGPAEVALCRGCAAQLGATARRVVPVPRPAGLPPVYAAAVYADAPRAVLLAHKERGALRLAGPLGAALARAVCAAAPAAAAGPGPLLLVPVPSARRSTAARGHDPVRRTALVAAARLRRAGVPARSLSVLRQQRPVADQAGLSAAERHRNLAGALRAAAGSARWLRQGVVLLVDDVLTTGASLAEAARAVRAAGGGVAGAAVVAAPRTSFEAGQRFGGY